MRVSVDLSRAWRRIGGSGGGVVGERERGGWFVEQDKGSAVPHGIFDPFRNELTAFFVMEHP
jgi:hypothetical protein